MKIKRIKRYLFSIIGVVAGVVTTMIVTKDTVSAQDVGIEGGNNCGGCSVCSASCCGNGTYYVPQSQVGDDAHCASCPTLFPSSPAGATSINQCYRSFNVNFISNGATSLGYTTTGCTKLYDASYTNTNGTRSSMGCSVYFPSVTRVGFVKDGWKKNNQGSFITSDTINLTYTATDYTNGTQYTTPSYYAQTHKNITGTITTGVGVYSISKTIETGNVVNLNTVSLTTLTNATITCKAGYYKPKLQDPGAFTEMIDSASTDAVCEQVPAGYTSSNGNTATTLSSLNCTGGYHKDSNNQCVQDVSCTYNGTTYASGATTRLWRFASNANCNNVKQECTCTSLGWIYGSNNKTCSTSCTNTPPKCGNSINTCSSGNASALSSDYNNNKFTWYCSKDSETISCSYVCANNTHPDTSTHSCVSNYKSGACTQVQVANGTSVSEQVTWTWNGSSWDKPNCTQLECNEGYEKIGNECVANCPSDQHRAGLECVDNVFTGDCALGMGEGNWIKKEVTYTRNDNTQTYDFEECESYAKYSCN